MSNQSARQASVRAITGTEYTYNGDWVALFDQSGIPAGEFNGRFLQWLNGQIPEPKNNLPDAMASYAINVAGVSCWNEVRDIGSLPLPVPELLTDIVISDTFFVGESLTVTNTGVWSNGPILEYQYRWVVDGVQSGDTSSTRLNITADDGKIAYCEVRARNSAGWSDWEVSNQYYIIRLALWLDAADTSTIIQSAGSVSQWNDKSGEGNNFPQASGANMPTTNTRTINGLNAIDFDGVNDFLGGISALNTILNGLHTVFAIGQSDVVSGTKCLIYGIAGASGRWGLLLPYNSSNQGGYRVGSSTFSTVNRTPNTSPHIVMGKTLSSSQYQCFVDGFAGNLQTNVDQPSLQNVTIGMLTSDTNTAFNGLVGEIWLAPRLLNDNEITQCNLRGKTKWGTP